MEVRKHLASGCGQPEGRSTQHLWLSGDRAGQAQGRVVQLGIQIQAHPWVGQLSRSYFPSPHSTTLEFRKSHDIHGAFPGLESREHILSTAVE